MGADATSISRDDLISLIGTAACPTIVDVRRAAAFAASDRLIATACWRDGAADGFGGDVPRDCDIVVYCVHGHEVSQSAAARLAAQGLRARFLEGGIEGYVAAGGPTMRRREDFDVARARPSRWITRARPKIDRIACPWLIRRFVDPMAETIYVPAERVNAEAALHDAVPFDVEGVFFSHRGERCSFDTLMDEFALHTPALDRLATIVRGADTARLDLAPQAAGLLAVSLGLSAIHADDQKMLSEGMMVYDALYAWCRHAVDERHNWPAASRAG